jgi:fatty acid desaturase
MPPSEPNATSRRDTPAASAQRAPQRVAVEIPTLLLIVATYAGWLGATFLYQRWPLWLVASLTTLLITLHSSVQHEIVHGHPTRWRALNRLFAIVPLALWLPYERYRHTHHAHHIDARLTDPLDDPESFYWRPEDWARQGAVSRWSLQLQQTLAGRFLIGSFWRIGMFLRDELLALRHHEARALVRNSQNVRQVWLEHLAWCVPVVLWLKLVCGMPLWLYFVAMVVPANGLQLVRSFAEHRASPGVRERIAIVENSWLLGPLFLFNNLHSLHHEAPGVPWYQYNARYRQERARLLAENGGLVYSTYFEVARRYLFRSHDPIPHPQGRIPPRPAPHEGPRAAA